MAKAWQSWESYHRINIRQKTMIMLMMPVISTLLHHRLRARSLFEECAWGFSFREKSRGTYPPSTRDKFFDEFFWQGTKSWSGKYIWFCLFSSNSMTIFIKKESWVIYSFSNPGLNGHDVSNGKQKSCDRKVQGRSRTLGLLGILRVTHRVIKEVGNTNNWLLTTNRKRLRKLKKR